MKAICSFVQIAKGKTLEKIGVNQFYCWNCYIELSVSKGKIHTHQVEEDGSLSFLMIYLMRMKERSDNEKGGFTLNLRNSLIALGVGAAAYQYARKQDVFSKRNMKKARKMIKSYL